MEAAIQQDLTLDQLKRILNEIRAETGEFALFDLLYPSPSDPGAYLSYSSKEAPANAWKMTLGNHGWSGGIYVIHQEFVEMQIMNLAHRGLINGLKINDVVFFSHYPLEPEEKNAKFIELLSSIHQQINT